MRSSIAIIITSTATSASICATKTVAKKSPGDGRFLKGVVESLEGARERIERIVRLEIVEYKLIARDRLYIIAPNEPAPE